jgi:hypothetical protein
MVGVYYESTKNIKHCIDVVRSDLLNHLNKIVNRLVTDFQSNKHRILLLGMIFLKFLDDYQQTDENGHSTFSLFSQRLKERRRMTTSDLSICPSQRFRQTFDLLEKKVKHASKSVNPVFSKFFNKLFD